MPKALVRHGLISYLKPDPDSDREYEDRAFRGMTVDLSQKEYDRLLAHGAIVAHDQELDQPGHLMVLPAGASNEEILNWAIAATPTEVAALATERPELADRLRDAQAEAEHRVKLYNERLGGVIDTAEEAAERAAKARQAAEEDLIGAAGGPAPDGGISPATGGNVAPPVANADGTVTEDVAVFDEVVKGNVREVEKYLSEHPEHAQQVLQAEERRSAARNENPRGSVRQAAEVAAQHAQQ